MNRKHFVSVLYFFSICLISCKQENKTSAPIQLSLSPIISNLEKREQVEKVIFYLFEAKKVREELLRKIIKDRVDSIDKAIIMLEKQKNEDLTKNNAAHVIDIVGGELNPNSSNIEEQRIVRILNIQDSIGKIYATRLKEINDNKNILILDNKKLIEKDDLIGKMKGEMDKQSLIKNQLDSIIQKLLSVGLPRME